TFLRTLGLGALALSTGRMPRLHADPRNTPMRNFVFCYFSGGWDILLSLDPKDPEKFPESKIPQTKIQLAWDRLPSEYPRTLIQPSGSNIVFGPIMETFAKHYNKCCVVRGVTSRTLSHQAGRRFFFTGEQPTGNTAKGSDIGARIVAQQGAHTPIPSLAMRVESYNSNLPHYASTLGMSHVGDLDRLLRDGKDSPSGTLRALLEEARARRDVCDPAQHNHEGLVDTLLGMQKSSRLMVSGDYAQFFDFRKQDDEMKKIYERYRLEEYYADRRRFQREGFAQAAIAYQALKHNVAQCVTIRIARKLDTHGPEWAIRQPQRQLEGFQALDLLLQDLDQTPHPKYGGSLLSHTTVVVYSEFARTP
ncbi:MAG: DUF1501 domain-containing protein, partial [Myxococcota bacterium]